MASVKTIEKKPDPEDITISCPICNKDFKQAVIEEHANKCLFLNTSEKSKLKPLKQNKEDQPNHKRNSSHFNETSLQEKRLRISTSPSSAKSAVSNKITRVK